MSKKAQQLFADAEAEGFVHLGWLTVTAFAPITVACFASVGGDVLLGFLGSLEDRDFQPLTIDLASQFAGDCELTTTTSSLIRPQTHRGILKYSHPKATVASLLRAHRKHMNELGEQVTLRVRTLADFETALGKSLKYELSGRFDDGRVQHVEKHTILKETQSGGKAAKTPAASHLLSFIQEWGHPEWVVLAVEAPADEVSRLYAELRSARKRLTEVPIHSRRKKDDEIAPLIAIVQPKDSSWSVILRVLCMPIGMPDITDAEKLCQGMTTTLKTRTLAFFGEDTSFTMSYVLYRNGRKVGSKDWESQTESADAAFADLGIYLPACYPRQEGKRTWICAEKASLDRIQRADVVDIGGI